MNRLALAAAAGLVAISLAACAPNTGEVVDKQAIAGYFVWQPGYYSGGYCTSYNSNGGCTSRSPRIYHPGYNRWVPPTWSIRLVNGEDTGWREVGEDLWQTCAVGMYFNGTKCQEERNW